MADHKYKLFRAIDPNKVTVPLNEKFSKLTLSSHKKRPQQREREPQQDQEQQIPQEALAMRDNLETEQLDGSDYMDALQLSANTDVDVEQLSASVSHLTMHSKQEQQQQPQQVSICISSTTEEDDAITISDTSEDEDQEQADPEPDSMAVSEREPEPAPQSILTSDKVQRIEAFLRDVERHVGDHTPPSSLASSYSARRRSQIALADTESMTTPHTDEEDWEQPPRPIDSSKRLADDDTVLDMDSSKRLADDATEANTLSSQSLEPESPEIKSISQRQAGNDTELNSTLQDEEAEEDEPIPEESIEIPETGSEGEEEGEAEAVASPLRPSSSSSSSSGNYETPSVQVSSINISAKINIKISIPTGYSSSGEEEEQEKEQEQAQRKLSSELVEVQEQKQLKQNQKSLISSSGDASEDEQFLSQAERLLNQLYGESWQTPDVIRTLKRSSGSGGQRKPLKPRNIEAPMAATTTKKKRQPAATTTTKKRQPARPKPVDESLLGDFSIFTRPLRTNQTPLNSTHLPPPQPPLRAVQTERRPRHPPRARTNHVDEERWRALIDSESGTDASDDEDADATYTGSESSSSDSGIKSRPKKAQDKDLTYLDLTKDEVEVISNPDEEEENSQSPKIHRRLDDILRSCRATSKLKLPATPPPPPPPAPQTTTRRQLFTPNAGYEDDNEAREIVAKALDLDMLDELENDYLPGTPVHKRLQEVKRNLGIVKPGETDLNKGKSIFDKATPKSSTRKKKEAVQPSQIQKGNGGKCSFLKSLEGQVSREKADNEAYFYRENFAKNKELLAQHLYKLFNAQVFNNELDVPLTWSKLLRNTAGRCMNKRKLNQRSSVVELSLKVLTTADRLRCTLIHELCHAAAWVFNGEGGHGRVWKMWAKRANDKFPDLPPIKVCHNYSIEFKYTYKCMSCNTSSHAHSRSRKVENLRCRLCRGPITLLLNKKDKQGNTVSTPAGEAKGFAKFVKDNFQKFKQDHLTAAQVMRLLGVEYAKQKEGEAASIASRVQTLTLDD
ncbi:hypothetical protein KR059_008522 [Drosophila kikkawai]|nr:hypothetical protein KR059_008522 [Drosophila kikkawai]